jgi:transcription initiation factor IIE alpha subunit
MVEPQEVVERSPRELERRAFICEAVDMKESQTEQMNASEQFCPNLAW